MRSNTQSEGVDPAGALTPRAGRSDLCNLAIDAAILVGAISGLALVLLAAEWLTVLIPRWL